jgi:hypothetical protein
MNTTAAINVVARCIARDAVKEDIRAYGRKISDYTLQELNELVRMYLKLCPGVFEQAEEIVRANINKNERNRRR